MWISFSYTLAIHLWRYIYIYIQHLQDSELENLQFPLWIFSQLYYNYGYRRPFNIHCTTLPFLKCNIVVTTFNPTNSRMVWLNSQSVTVYSLDWAWNRLLLEILTATMNSVCEKCRSSNVITLKLRNLYLCGDCENISRRGLEVANIMPRRNDCSMAIYERQVLHIFLSCM